MQHKDVLSRMLWESDILLDYELSNRQVVKLGEIKPRKTARSK